MVASLGWWVLRVTLLEPDDRSDASGYGQFVLAAVGLVIMIAGWLWKVFFTPVPASNLDELADALALSMRRQWEAAAVDRRLLQPAPLPVRWRRSERPLAGPVGAATMAGHPPLPGLTRVTASRLRGGTHRNLHSVYGGLPSGRLIIAGGPGAGKSSAAVLLLLDALRYREQAATDADRAMIPVPVMFTLHGWDPRTTSVADWITAKLTEVPLFSGRYGAVQAGELVGAGRVAVFLDGLDEVPEKVRPSVLQALSEQTTGRLVLLSRCDELESAAGEHGLAGAVALELQPLTAKDAADYLLRPLTEPAPAAWTAVANTLLARPDSPVGTALTVPLNIGLVRDVYPPTGRVDELLDAERFPDAGAIVDHLLDQAVVAAYASRPGRKPPRYASVAGPGLAYLARQLKAAGTHDFMWWQVPLWLPPYLRILLTTAAGGLVGLVVFLVVSAPQWWRETDLILPYMRVGLVFGFAAGLGVGVIGPGSPARIKVSLRRIVTIRPLTVGLFAGMLFGVAVWVDRSERTGNDLTTNLVVGLVVGLLMGLIGEMVASFPRRKLSTGRFSRSIRSRPLLFGLATGGFPGLVFGLLAGFGFTNEGGVRAGVQTAFGLLVVYGGAAGLAFAFMGRLMQPNSGDTRAGNPVDEWRYERLVGLVFGIISALLFGVIFSVAGASYGLVFGLGTGLTSGICVPQFFAAAVAQAYLAVRYRVPFRLVRFLEDARARHLIRAVGPVYQFRHALVRDRLAGSGSPAVRTS
jgi:hypothetical protein